MKDIFKSRSVNLLYVCRFLQQNLNREVVLPMSTSRISVDVVVVTTNVYKLDAYAVVGSTLAIGSMRLGCLVPAD